jgi:diguanylate cyclase (GGDEF)-like protein
VIAYSAAVMYGSAALLGVIEGLTPGGASIDLVPSTAAGALAVLVALVGPRLPRWALAPLGPLGAALIAYALTNTPGAGDGAVLYVWPVLWTAYFFGRLGTIGIVAWVAIVHALALRSLPAGAGYVDRWIDVVGVLGTTAAVIHLLSKREQELAAELRAEARVDTLTGLLNRRGFEERVPHELALALRNGWTLSLVSFDIDRFKSVNDEWGHETGDRVLARFGRALREHARSIDLTARIGGEEFVALLPETDSATAHRFAERVRTAFIHTNEPGVPGVTVSAGVASAAAPDADLELLLREADRALYVAKRSGRNQTVSRHSLLEAAAPRVRVVEHSAP